MTHQEARNILGITNTATNAELRSAYRDLAKVWHPDRWGHDQPLQARAQEKLKNINLAYDLLLSGAQRVPPGPPGPPASKPHAPQQDQPSGRERSDNVPPRPSPFHQETPRQGSAAAGRVNTAPIDGGIFVVIIGFTLLLAVAIIQSSIKVEIPTTPAPSVTKQLQNRRPASSDSKEVFPVAEDAKTRPKTDALEQGRPAAEESTDLRVDKQIATTIPFTSPKPLVTTETTTPVPVPAPSAPELQRSSIPAGYFTVGSTKDEVLAAQGTPSELNNTVWKYGSSSVFFQGDRVTRWDVWPGSPLKVRLLPSGGTTTRREYFTVGSTKDEVLAAQGTPSELGETVWKYGSSSVYFRAGLAIKWDIWPGSPLNVQMSGGDGRVSATPPQPTASGIESTSRMRAAERLAALGLTVDWKTMSLSEMLEAESRMRAAGRLNNLGLNIEWRTETLSAMLDTESRVRAAERLKSLGLSVDWRIMPLSEMLDAESRIRAADRLRTRRNINVDWRKYSISQLLEMERR